MLARLRADALIKVVMRGPRQRVAKAATIEPAAADTESICVPQLQRHVVCHCSAITRKLDIKLDQTAMRGSLPVRGLPCGLPEQQ